MLYCAVRQVYYVPRSWTTGCAEKQAPKALLSSLSDLIGSASCCHERGIKTRIELKALHSRKIRIGSNLWYREILSLRWVGELQHVAEVEPLTMVCIQIGLKNRVWGCSSKLRWNRQAGSLCSIQGSLGAGWSHPKARAHLRPYPGVCPSCPSGFFRFAPAI